MTYHRMGVFDIRGGGVGWGGVGGLILARNPKLPNLRGGPLGTLCHSRADVKVRRVLKANLRSRGFEY